MKDMLFGVAEAEKDHANFFLVEVSFEDKVLGTQPKTPEALLGFLKTQLLREEIAKLRKENKSLSAQQARDQAAENIKGRVAEMYAEHARQLGLPEEMPTEEKPSKGRKKKGKEVVKVAEDVGDSDGAPDSVEEKIALARTTFFADENGPWLGTYQMKACLRDIMSSIGMTVEKKGTKQTHQHLLSVLACDEDGNVLPGDQVLRLHFIREDEYVEKPDGHVEMTAHVRTPQGEKSIIKQHDFIEKASLRFLIKLPARISDSRRAAVIDEEDLSVILMHTQGNGLGCSRSQGYGTFRVTKFVMLTDNPWTK